MDYNTIQEGVHLPVLCLMSKKKNKEKKVVHLLNGHDIMNKFKLSPSVLVGKILNEIEEAQAIGEIRDKNSAFKLAAKIIKQNR